MAPPAPAGKGGVAELAPAWRDVDAETVAVAAGGAADRGGGGQPDDPAAPLDAAVEQIRADGRLAPEQAAELTAADELVARAERYAAAYEAAAACMLGRSF